MRAESDGTAYSVVRIDGTSGQRTVLYSVDYEETAMRVPVLTSALLIVVSVCCAAQPMRVVRPSVSQVLEQMTSSKWKERRAAFYDALALLESGKQRISDSDMLRRSLIQLLAAENSLNKPPEELAKQKPVIKDDTEDGVDKTLPPGTWSEERSEYYAELIGSVADLDDERAIPVLLAAAPTGGMATRGVARFGTIALDAVLAQVQGPDSDLAAGALFVIVEMLKLHTVNDAASQLRIKSALRAALASSDPRRRNCAVYAIEHLDDREEFVPTLRQLAEHDPAKLSGQPLKDGSIGDIYFVRRNAKRVLDSIARHEPLPSLPRTEH